MTVIILRPWLSTPDAVEAAHAVAKTPLRPLGSRARIVGADELVSEAFAVLAEMLNR